MKNNIPSKAVQPFARRWVATTPQRAPQSRSNSLSDLDDSSSFLTPPPSDKDIESFKAQHQKRREKQLPGNRYAIVQQSDNQLTKSSKLPVPSAKVLQRTSASRASPPIF